MKTKCHLGRRKGQVALEYIIILVVIVSILAILTPTLQDIFGGFFFGKATQISENKVYNSATSTGSLMKTTDTAYLHEEFGHGALNKTIAHDTSTTLDNLTTPTGN